MGFVTSFARVELKYFVTRDERERILQAAYDTMMPDKYGKSTVRNVYYDTPTFLLARRSAEKPLYKEKLRLRAYKRVGEEEHVFAELKKKADGIVYKRRLVLPEHVAADWYGGASTPDDSSQIFNEIDFAVKRYEGLKPVVYLAYDRQAYMSKDGSEFRLTFDENIRYRLDGLTLCDDDSGTQITAHGVSLMEVKCDGRIPLWLANLLSEMKIYKTSFSKYGAVYESVIFPTMLDNFYHKEYNNYGNTVQGTV